jgi:acyl-CoA synthetase (AMP-forming)/AMP-acid ligase II
VLRAFQQRFARWGFRAEALTPVYGLSEAALAVTFSAIDRPFTSRRFDRDLLAASAEARDDDSGVELVSVGRPLPDFEIRIVDRERRELPDGKIGSVLARGPSLMSGYFGQPLSTAKALRDGWLETGDLGFTFDGELYLSGRAKDVIILRGRNHAPHEVEHAVDTVEGVRTGCSVAASYLPDGADGEVLVVLVEASRSLPVESYAGTAGEVARAVRSATGLEADRVEVLAPGTLPRTSSGKMRRHAALGAWLRGQLTPPEDVTLLRVAGAVARSSLAMARARRGGDGG